MKEDVTAIILRGREGSGDGRVFASWRIEAPVQSFKAPKDTIGDLDADAAAAVLAAAADVALVLDREGLILDCSIQTEELAAELEGAPRWLGQAFADIVTEDTRPKAVAMVAAAARAAPAERPRWRQLHHPSVGAAELPILYCIARLGRDDRLVVLGRDMRSLATLQQRLVETQMAMEREYSRLRHAETRYRMLFQLSSEPVLIVDAATDRVVEANPAAVQTFGDCVGRTIGRKFPPALDGDGLQVLLGHVAAVRSGRPAEPARVRVAGTDTELTVAATMFRQGAAAFYLMRFSRETAGAAAAPRSNADARRLGFVSWSTDAYVVIDQDGRILTANPAFLQMTQILTEDQARGEGLERWLGRSSVDVDVLIANVRQHETVTMFPTLLRGEFGTSVSVEVSAFALGEGDRPAIGLAIRNVERRIASTSGSIQLHRSVDQLKELIGRVSLKDLVRESTDMIERLCIEAALELTGDNRASAAEMLGLSRQSLYVKLRRYGLDGAEAPSES